MRDRCDADIIIGDQDHKSKTFLSGLSSSYNQLKLPMYNAPSITNWHLTSAYSISGVALHWLHLILDQAKFTNINFALNNIICLLQKVSEQTEGTMLCNSLPNNISSCLLSVFPRPQKQQISAGKSKCGLQDTVLVVYNSSA